MMKNNLKKEKMCKDIVFCFKYVISLKVKGFECQMAFIHVSEQ